MKDPVRVGVRHRLADAAERDKQRRQVVRRRPVAKEAGEGVAAYELHGVERPAVGEAADLVDRDDAGALHLGHDAGLALELLDRPRPAGEPSPQHLDRDRPAHTVSTPK